MVTVRLLCGLANASRAYDAGELYSCSPAEAARLVAAGLAAAIDPSRIEAAVKRKARRRG